MKSQLTCFIFLICFSLGFSQNGKILSKELINLSETSIWSKLTTNNELKPDYKHLDALNFYAITYESDGHKVNGIITEPKKEGTYPVVIFNRGGNRDYGSLTIATIIFSVSKLAEQGYVIIGSNYRTQDEFGGADLNDVLNLFETIKEIDKADESKVGMFGWSRGGMMTYLALKASDKIQTAIIGNGPSNLFAEISFRPKMETLVYAQCIPNYATNKDAELKKRSAIFWADKLNKDSSLLILSGTKDKRVDPKQANIMAEELERINYDFKLMTFETDHGFRDKRDELYATTIAWFDKELKHKK